MPSSSASGRLCQAVHSAVIHVKLECARAAATVSLRSGERSTHKTLMVPCHQCAIRPAPSQLPGLGNGLALQPRLGVGISTGGLVCTVPLSSSHTADQHGLKDGAGTWSDSKMIWHNVKPAAALDVTLRRLHEWLQHSSLHFSRHVHHPLLCGSHLVAILRTDTARSVACSDTPAHEFDHLTHQVASCRTEVACSAASLLMSSMVLQNVSRHQPPERCKLSRDVGESPAAAVDQQPHPTAARAGLPAMESLSAAFPAVSPVRALLTGEGMVPQVGTTSLWQWSCRSAYDQQRQCADTLHSASMVTCSARTCCCVQMQLQQTSPQLLCLLLQLLSASSQGKDMRHEQASDALAKVCCRMSNVSDCFRCMWFQISALASLTGCSCSASGPASGHTADARWNCSACCGSISAGRWQCRLRQPGT